MLFSVIILSYNSERTISKCLSRLSVALSEFSENSEVFIVENGSRDNSKSIIEDYVKNDEELFKPIFLSKNTGTTFSRNLALSKASGKYVLILDSDAFISGDAIKVLQQTLESSPDIGMAVPKLFYADGRFQMSTDVFPTITRKVHRFLSLDKLQKVASNSFNTQHDVDYAISACWLLKKEVVDAIGGFDEKIFYSPEDVDYCIRVWEQKYRIVFSPHAEVFHDAQELSRGFKLSFFHFSHLAGLFYLFKKHRYIFSLNGLYGRLGVKR
jgi:GT2 family glycosyltransferase